MEKSLIKNMKEQRLNLSNCVIDKSWTLFLDRDGVINERIKNGYVTCWEDFKLLPGVIKALKILRSIFGRLIIITNQRGIALGLMSEEDLKLIHKNMLKLFSSNGITIDAIYYCPHNLDENCECRKPRPGMIKRALLDFPDIDLKKAILVGDTDIDIQTAKNAGIYSIHVGDEELLATPDLKFIDLYDFSIQFQKIAES